MRFHHRAPPGWINDPYGLTWHGGSWPINIDLWGQFHALMPRTHTKDPAAFDPDEMLPFDSIRASGRILVGGLSMGVAL